MKKNYSDAYLMSKTKKVLVEMLQKERIETVEEYSDKLYSKLLEISQIPGSNESVIEECKTFASDLVNDLKGTMLSNEESD